MSGVAAEPPGLSERFLGEFHNARPGLTSEAFADLPVQGDDGRQYASSYEALVADAMAAQGGQSSASGRSVLDLACGDGYLLERLARTCAPDTVLLGVDLSAGELAAAQARLGARAVLWQARAQALPLSTASVDLVTCHMALMLMDALDAVLAEVRRVLRPGGRLCAVVGASAPASAAGDAFLAALRSRAPQTRWQALRLGDRRVRTAEGITQALGPHFDDVEVHLLRAQRRLTPEALWDWYERMYDLALLHPDDRAPVREAFLRLAGDAADPDGLMLHSIHLHHCTARR